MKIFQNHYLQAIVDPLKQFRPRHIVGCRSRCVDVRNNWSLHCSNTEIINRLIKIKNRFGKFSYKDLSENKDIEWPNKTA